MKLAQDAVSITAKNTKRPLKRTSHGIAQYVSEQMFDLNLTHIFDLSYS